MTFDCDSFFSGPNDHIFVFFTDHGAPGIIAFPSDEVSLTDSPSTWGGDTH